RQSAGVSLSGLLDELARRLARSQTRRSALKTVGGVLAAAFVPALGASRARAGTSTAVRSGCSTTCSNPSIPQVCNCHENAAGACLHDCCGPEDTCCCPPEEVLCCPPGTKCSKTGCECLNPCGTGCCKPTEECLRGSGIVRCIPKCPDDQKRC